MERNGIKLSFSAYYFQPYYAVKAYIKILRKVENFAMWIKILDWYLPQIRKYMISNIQSNSIYSPW